MLPIQVTKAAADSVTKAATYTVTKASAYTVTKVTAYTVTKAAAFTVTKAVVYSVTKAAAYTVTKLLFGNSLDKYVGQKNPILFIYVLERIHPQLLAFVTLRSNLCEHSKPISDFGSKLIWFYINKDKFV